MKEEVDKGTKILILGQSDHIAKIKVQDLILGDIWNTAKWFRPFFELKYVFPILIYYMQILFFPYLKETSFSPSILVSKNSYHVPRAHDIYVLWGSPDAISKPPPDNKIQSTLSSSVLYLFSNGMSVKTTSKT